MLTCNCPYSIYTEDEIKIIKYGLQEEDVTSSLLEKSDLMEEERNQFPKVNMVEKIKKTTALKEKETTYCGFQNAWPTTTVQAHYCGDSVWHWTTSYGTYTHRTISVTQEYVWNT